MTVFGTRPEGIKLGPVICELRRSAKFDIVNISSGQHRDLLEPFLLPFHVSADHDLRVMEPNQTPGVVCARVMTLLDPIVAEEKPDLILVQGDTSTALAGALAAFYQHIPVGHIEAGLRSGDISSPDPEEMHRRLITRLATYHFAATAGNRDTLLSEGIEPKSIFVTGNPIVDALECVLKNSVASRRIDQLLSETASLKRITLTMQRRESFEEFLPVSLRVVRDFVTNHDDVGLMFPVHPNPAVVRAASEILGDHPRVYRMPPLPYEEFVHLLLNSWLILSDSGGIQEEVSTIGKPLVILRRNTERPEVIQAGAARLVGGAPEYLATMLEEAYQSGSWANRVGVVPNPFGTGDSGRLIAESIAFALGVQQM